MEDKDFSFPLLSPFDSCAELGSCLPECVRV